MLFTQYPFLCPYRINTTLMCTQYFIGLYNNELTSGPNHKGNLVKSPNTPIKHIFWEKIGQSLGDQRYKLYITTSPEEPEFLKQVNGVLNFEPNEYNTLVELIIYDERLQYFWEDLKDFYRRKEGYTQGTL